jgi:hypothetical protein
MTYPKVLVRSEQSAGRWRAARVDPPEWALQELPPVETLGPPMGAE